MSYRLTFDPWSETDQSSLIKFVLLYQAFLGTADNPNRSRSLEETRQAIKILDLFASVSNVVNPGSPNENRLLMAGGGSISLTESEYSLIKRCVETYVAQVPFSIARSAMELQDFVESAVKE
jgi:hypothetical protein